MMKILTRAFINALGLTIILVAANMLGSAWADPLAQIKTALGETEQAYAEQEDEYFCHFGQCSQETQP